MKCKLKNDQQYKHYGMMNGLLANNTYEVMYIQDEYCIVLIDNNAFFTIHKEFVVEAFDFTYEVGDMVKTIKNISLDLDTNVDLSDKLKEVGKIALIEKVSKCTAFKYPYQLENLLFLRCNEELELVKTKYELEQEKKEMKLHKVTRDENKSGITKNVNKPKFGISNADITVYEKDSDKILFKGIESYSKKSAQERAEYELNNYNKGFNCSDLINYIYKNAPSINPIKPIITYKKGDILKIIGGKYKDSNIEGVFIDYEKDTDFILIQIDERNTLSINKNDVELIEKKIIKYNMHKTETQIINLDLRDEINNIVIYKGQIKVKFSRNKIIVILEDGTKGSSLCCLNDSFDEEKGIKIALFRALLNQNYNRDIELKNELRLLNTRVEVTKISLKISDLEKEAFNKQLQELIK